MEPEQLVILIALSAAAALGIILLVRNRERKRTSDLEGIAMRIGMSFAESDETLEHTPFTRLPLFNRGHGRRFKNVLRGQQQLVFDYQYTTGGGKNKSTRRQTVTVFQKPRLRLPTFQVAPEAMIDKISELFGGQDFDFGEDPDFSRRFRLRGTNEDAVRDLFGKELRRQLVSISHWSLEGEGEWLVLYRNGQRTRPSELTAFLDAARTLVTIVESSERSS